MKHLLYLLSLRNPTGRHAKGSFNCPNCSSYRIYTKKFDTLDRLIEYHNRVFHATEGAK